MPIFPADYLNQPVLPMPDDMEDQPVMEKIREAKRRRGMQEAYDETTVKKAKGGATKGYAKGGSVRGDGCAQRGKTKGTMR